MYKRDPQRTEKRIIQGVSFEFSSGFQDHAGIKYLPEDNDNPNDVVLAFQKALELWPSFEMVDRTEFRIYFQFSARYADRGEAVEIIDWINQCLAQSEWKVDKEFLNFTKQALLYRIDEIDRKEIIAQKKKTVASGYVYLIKSPTGAYKIGRTQNPDNRLKTFEVRLPFEIDYTHLIPTDNMRGLESALHRKYKNQKINGEWFNLNQEDVDYIKSL